MQGHVIGWIIVIDNHQLQYDVIMIVTNVSECLILSSSKYLCGKLSYFDMMII